MCPKTATKLPYQPSRHLILRLLHPSQAQFATQIRWEDVGFRSSSTLPFHSLPGCQGIPSADNLLQASSNTCCPCVLRGRGKPEGKGKQGKNSPWEKSNNSKHMFWYRKVQGTWFPLSVHMKEKSWKSMNKTLPSAILNHHIGSFLHWKKYTV